jgi:hypothetical protein
MPPKKQQKKNPKKKTLKPRIRKILGSGDYTLDTPKNVVDAIRNIDKRINKLDERPKVSDIAGSAARKLGSMVPIPGAGDLMADAASGLAKYFGFGDYELEANTIMKGMAEASLSGAADITQFSSHKRGLRIADREYIGDVFAGTVASGSTAFSLSQYHINPGDSTTFPWLSIIAQNYEEWEPHGMVFEFKSTSSTFNGSSQALGTVFCSTDYNPNDPVFANKIQMEQADFSNSGSACNNLIHGIECAVGERSSKVLYVRNTPFSAATKDPRFTDLGNFQIATQGMSVTGVNLGELWVSYDITLYKKALNPSTAFNSASNATITTAALFGTGAPIRQNGTLCVTVSGNVMTLPVGIVSGRYLLWMQVIATTSNLGAGVPVIIGGQLVRQNSSSAGVVAMGMVEFDVKTNSIAPCTVDMTGWTSTAPTNVLWSIIPVPPTYDYAGN